jgi:hypothetical protein
MTNPGAKPREPASLEKLRLFCDALTFLCNPTAASKRLNETANEFRTKFEIACSERERALAARAAELDRRQENLDRWEAQLTATAKDVEARSSALATFYEGMERALGA